MEPSRTNRRINTINCLQLNFNRNHKVLNEVIGHDKLKDIDIIFITEPYTGKYLYAKTIQGYTLYQNVNKKDKKSKCKTAIAIKSNKFSATLINPTTTDNLTVIQARDLSGMNIYLYSVYIEPKIDVDNTLNKLKGFLSLNPNAIHIVTGDFNAWNTMWGSRHCSRRGDDIVNIIIDYDLILVNTGDECTYSTVANNAIRSSHIDLTMISDHRHIRITDWKINHDITTLSDHKSITFTINLDKNRQLTKNLKNSTWRYNTSKPNFWTADKRQEFKLELNRYISRNEINNILCMNKTQLDNYINEFIKSINNTCQKTLPRSSGRPSKPHWWTDELEILKKKVIQNHHKLSKAARRGNPIEELIKEKLEIKEHYAKAIQEASTKSFKEFCNMQEKENVWSVTNRIIRTKPVAQPPSTLKKSNGEYTRDVDEAAQYFVNGLFPTDTEDNEIQRSIRARMYLPPNTQNEPLFNTTEIIETLKTFNSKKAPGYDGLTADICLVATESYPEIVTNILNQALILEYFPKPWKRAIAKIIPKPGKETYDTLTSFRPIGLIPVFGKLYEKLLINRLNHHMYTNQFDNEKQYGFKLQKSTVMAVNKAIKIVREAKDAGQQVAIVSLDIRGAFDNAWWPSIFCQLKRIKCPRNIYGILLSYTEEREVVVRLSDVESTRAMSRGCIQGSVCGPPMWNLIMDDLLSIPLPDETYLQAYADDVLLISAHKNIQSLEDNINRTINKILKWGNVNKLTFSPEKTQLIAFTNKAKNIQIQLNDKYLKHVNNIKYLGINIDSKLTFTNHVKYIIDKTKKLFNKLKIYVRPTWGIHPENVRTIYQQVIVPILSYGASIWEPALKNKYIQKQLLSHQRRFCIKIIRSFRTINTPLSIVLSQLPPLPMQIKTIANNEKTKLNESSPYLPDDITLETPAHPRMRLHPVNRKPVKHYIANDQNELEEVFLRHTEIIYYLYTDGSKSDDNVGAAVVIQDSQNIIHKELIKLHSSCSVYQAEQLAIATACKWVRDQRVSAFVVTDSLSTLQGLCNSNTFNPHAVMTLKCIHEIERNGQQIKFVWVKAHNDIPGNELADITAKEAAGSRTNTNYAKFPISFVKEINQKSLTKEITNLYNEVDNCKYTKQIFPDYTSLKKFIDKVPPNFAVTQFLSGHGYHKAYLHRFRITQDPFCPCDSNTIQTMEHLLYHCPKYFNTRYEFETICRINNIDFKDCNEITKKEETLNKFMIHLNEIIYSLKKFNNT